MMNAPIIAGINFRSYEIMNMSLILVPIFLFTIYKIISTCQRNRIKRLKIEKGILTGRSKHRGGSVWIRSIYTGVGLMVASGALTSYIIIYQGGLRNNFQPFLMFCLPFGCVGIGYLIRGILKRKSYLRKLSLSNGIPFEVICPPQKHWILPMAIGLPLLITAGVLQRYYSNGGDLDELMPILVLVSGIPGGILFFYSLLIRKAINKNKASAVSAVDDTIPPVEEPTQEPNADDDFVFVNPE